MRAETDTQGRFEIATMGSHEDIGGGKDKIPAQIEELLGVDKKAA